MPFIDLLEKYEHFDFEGFFDSRADADVENSLAMGRLGIFDFLTLLSNRAADHLEDMAKKARQITIQYFGRTIQLYIPLYISNYCSSECVYCGFSRKQRIKRKKLTLTEIEREARVIDKTGIRHILILTGESPQITPVGYLESTMKILKSFFDSLSIEVFPMDVADYIRLKQAGVDGLTIYQEVYNREIYRKVHLAGRKTDYKYRLNAPERGARAGFRSVNIGALLGLADPRKEAFFTGLHARYLEDNYPGTEVSVSLPRMNPEKVGFQPSFPVDDRTFVQLMIAFRLFLPRVGIPISTRERPEFRDRLMFLGATRFSAGSRTDVGGYSINPKGDFPQFQIHDNRTVMEIAEVVRSAGFQPVYKDWEIF